MKLPACQVYMKSKACKEGGAYVLNFCSKFNLSTNQIALFDDKREGE